jgi:NAD(P)-dependent dehydrogenase (short-subunit alcohol dehydrogenase family)
MTDPLPPPPCFRCDGERALITGASRGIGRAAAIALAQAGAEVTLAARSVADCEETAAALRAAGLHAKAAALDVTDRAAVRGFVAAEPPFGILVNNAGTNIREPFLEVRDDSLDQLLDLNVRAMFTVAQAVARRLVAAGQPGSLINVSSINGHRGGVNRSAYTATKHAVEGATKGMAAELGPHGIRVNTLCPFFVETPLTAGILSDERFRNALERRVPLGRILRTEDLVGAVVFLASPASAMVSGLALIVDGGFNVQ